MRRELDERFAAYVRDRGDHHLRVAVLLTGDWHAGEDLLQASLAKLYRAWPRLDTTADPDAYLRRVMVNTRRSWWRTRWRQETPTAVIPESATAEDLEDRRVLAAVLAGTSAVRLPAGRPPSTGRPPSALAAVIEAATRTAATSYQVSATYSFWVTPPNTISPAQMTATGMFDPANGVAEVTSPYFPSIRWVAGYVYVRIGEDGKPWVRFRKSAVHLVPGPHDLPVGPLAVAQEDPQSLLAELKSASQVRTVGPASGPGWTGTRYGFTSRSAFGDEAEISITGTVDVDRQGRVRTLHATEVMGYPGQDQMEFRTGIRLAFGGFGAPVSVTAPPASETQIGNTGEILLLK